MILVSVDVAAITRTSTAAAQDKVEIPTTAGAIPTTAETPTIARCAIFAIKTPLKDATMLQVQAKASNLSQQPKLPSNFLTVNS